VGERGVVVHVAGYLEQSATSVFVAKGRETMNVDFVLSESPILSGRVVDERGVALSAVKVTGWPESGGGSVSAWSDEHGGFVLHLARDVPHRLEAGRAGPRTSGEWRAARPVYHDPWTRDIRVEAARDEPDGPRVIHLRGG
jgi:hypothetical protein